MPIMKSIDTDNNHSEELRAVAKLYILHLTELIILKANASSDSDDTFRIEALSTKTKTIDDIFSFAIKGGFNNLSDEKRQYYLESFSKIENHFRIPSKNINPYVINGVNLDSLHEVARGHLDTDPKFDDNAKSITSEFLTIQNLKSILLSFDIDESIRSNKNILDEYVDQSDKLIESMKVKSQKFNQAFDELDNEYEKVVFSKIYQEEIDQYKKYRFYANCLLLIFGGLLTSFLIFASIQNVMADLKPTSYNKIVFDISFIYKAFIIIFISGAIGYLVKVSRNHRKVAIEAKFLEAQLDALPSYTRQLNDKQRNDLRFILALRFFSNQNYSSGNKKVDELQEINSLMDSVNKAKNTLSDLTNR